MLSARLTQFFLIVIPIFLWGNTAYSQTLAARRFTEPPRPDWLEKDSRLQSKVSINVKTIPLRNLLNSITAQTKVPLSASSRLMDFRVSISSQARPLSEIMMRIQDLFHHGGKLSVASCYWQREEQKDGRLSYSLYQSRLGITEEEENAGTPVQTLAKWLRAVRDYVKTDPDKRREFKTDFPYLRFYARTGDTMDDESTGPLSIAVSTLTDAEIEMLAKTGRVNATNFILLPPQIENITNIAKSSGFYDPKADQPPCDPYLQFRPDTQPGRYDLYLGFASGSITRLPGGFNFDTLDNGGEYDWINEMLAKMQQEERSKPVELIDPQKRVAGKTPVMSLATALELWGRATGRNVFGEIFLKEKAPFPITSDKPETLLMRICVKFGYDWRKVGEDYLVYSKSWAADRASDIPGTLLDKWQTVIKKQEMIPLNTLLEMSQLREQQINTLQDYLFINVFRRSRNLHTLRILNTLSKAKRESALSAKEGVELNTFDAQIHTALTRLFPKVADFQGTSLRLESLTTDKFPAYTITVTLPSGESQHGFFSLTPPQFPKQVYQ